MAVGSDATHKRKRRRLRAKLESLGYSPVYVERAVEELRQQQESRRAQVEDWQRQREQWEAEVYAQPDDSHHRPSTPDRLRTGQARVTGTTARVAGRQYTITRWQHDEIEAGRSGR